MYRSQAPVFSHMDFIHALSRGVDKRKIFLDKQDHLRFIHDLFEFNDQEPINNVSYHFSSGAHGVIRSPIAGREDTRSARRLLVIIHAFCLMPNHYHLFLSPRVENGVSLFMKKLNIGYAKYFNQKYERTGTLFESRYKSVPVTEERHLLHLPYYIHLNPLDLFAPEWRDRKLEDYQKALKFLDTYRWSSFIDYCGGNNFPSVTQREFLLKYLGEPREFRREIIRWLKDIDVDAAGPLLLE